jgi:hypothetical protein
MSVASVCTGSGTARRRRSTRPAGINVEAADQQLPNAPTAMPGRDLGCLYVCLFGKLQGIFDLYP